MGLQWADTDATDVVARMYNGPLVFELNGKSKEFLQNRECLKYYFKNGWV
jgi:hypothetical protein